MSSDRRTDSSITTGSQRVTCPGYGAKRDARQALTHEQIVAEAVQLFEDNLALDATPRQADESIMDAVNEITDKYGIDDDSDLAEQIRAAVCEKSGELAPGDW